MNDIEHSNRQIHIIKNPLSFVTRPRRTQRQRISPSPEPKPNHLTSRDYPPSAAILDRSKMTNQVKQHLADSTQNSSENNDAPPTILLLAKKTSSTSDLGPFELKKQAALAKAEGKLEKAQRLYQSAQQSVEQNISEFLRVTTIPGILHESKTTNAAYEKRIRTLQETKKELEKKIANYQADINRIQSGEIPPHYSSSKDILNNIKNKVSGGSSRQNSANDISMPGTYEPSILESDNQLNLPTISVHQTMNTNNQHLLSLTQNTNTLEVTRSSPSNSISNDTDDHSYDRRHDIFVSADLLALHDADRSPSTKRRLTGDSNTDFNDRISDHSNDDRFMSYNTSKRNTMSTSEHHQLMIKIDFMQKTVDRYETKMTEMQKQLDSLAAINENQHEQNERLDTEITDLTDLHQIEMSVMKTDLKKLEEKLLYNFNDNWTEMVEKLDKLETRTTKVEQTQAHSHETEENTHRIISKFVNILLTVFAIILLLLSTAKNLVQSRVHAVIFLILIFTWISIRYLPDSYFHTNFTTIFKRTS